MPDDSTRSTQIERSIDRDIANALTMTPHGGSVFTVAPRSMGELLEFAKLMSVSGICIRPMFRGNPGACLALTLQAMKWGADPFAVANKAFEVNGQLAYESQLINAIVNASPALAQRLNAAYIGEGPTRQCLVTGVIKGESEAREYTSPKLSDITPKNSPLWKTDPDQQLFYYSSRAWARRWVPEVLLGIYTPDEIGRTIEMVPAEEPRREDFIPVAKPEPIDDRPVYTVVDLDGVEHEYREEATAGAALGRVLDEATKMGPERLAGARESNGLPPLDPPPPKRQRQPRREPDPRAGAEPADDADRIAGAPPVSVPAAQSDGRTVGSIPATGASPTPQPWPLDPPETREEVVQHGQAEQIETEAPGRDPGAAPQPEANDDPDRASLEIAPPIRRGRPDYRTWMIVLLLPKLRQAKDARELAFRLGDNEEHLTAARRELARDDLATLEEAIATRWKEIGND